ncbi:MAG TPA: heavy metal-responsive transcriptional regulator [Actinomycetes bacterium]|nr:heavy metal-responsive transcriptional regulator [Actinomycetes bacterium]
MRVGEVAERAGVNVETLRYYERRGLLPAPERAPSGHRRYDEETVRFLRAIKEAQAVGFALAEIADYLRAARRSTAPSETLRVQMAAKIDDIDARIAALRRMRDELGQDTNRLVETDDGTPLPPPPPLSDSQLFARLQLRLTATGEGTLRGRADRVELLGIDRWIGGTHITRDNTWRWHPTEWKLGPPSRR